MSLTAREEVDRLAEEAGDEIYEHLRALSLIFVVGAELTLVVRTPSAPDGTLDAVFTTKSTRCAGRSMPLQCFCSVLCR